MQEGIRLYTLDPDLVVEAVPDPVHDLSWAARDQHGQEYLVHGFDPLTVEEVQFTQWPPTSRSAGYRRVETPPEPFMGYVPDPRD